MKYHLILLITFVVTITWGSGCAGQGASDTTSIDVIETSGKASQAQETPTAPNDETGAITTQEINSFEACAQAGFPVMESYPRQCRTADGKSFTEALEDSATTVSSTVQPENPAEIGLSNYPDNPLETIPAEPISVKFLIEHRSALNNQGVQVRGVVVETLLGEKACPPDRGMCAQPSIYLAETMDANRDPNYDLRILVNEAEQEADYPIGETVELQALVQANQTTVILQKVYR
jgi:hypothetical protein